MATRIDMWRTDDGKLFASLEAAQSHESEIDSVRMATATLGPAPRLDERTYYQHRAVDVMAARNCLLILTRPKLADWFARQEAMNPDIDWLTVDPGWYCRLLDDNGPIDTAWCRILCIDAQNREWQQQYFVKHPPSYAVELGSQASSV